MSDAPSLASIGIKIESTDAATAAQRLDQLAQSGDQVEKVVGELAATSRDTAAQLGNVGAAAKQVAQAQGATNQSIAAATISAKQYAQSLRLLPVQIHQGFDQLLYGTNPLIVLATQLPQISESFGGIGNAVKALATFITPTSVAITALAAAVGLLGYEWYEAMAQEDAFRKVLLTTGDAAGLTLSQLEQLQQQIKDVSGASRSVSATALTTTLAAGITQNVGQVAQLAAEMQKVAGIPIATTVKEFASLGDDPLKAAESLQKTFAFLTPEILDDIAALEKQGKTTQATAVAYQALIDKLTDVGRHLKENEGLWAKLANTDFGKTISSVSGLLSSIESIPGPGGAFAVQQQIANAGADPAAAAEAKAKAAAAQAAAVKEAEFTTSLLPQSLSAGLAAGQQPEVLTITAASNEIQRQLQAELAATQRYDQLLDAEHSAHLISDQAYYDAKTRAISVDTQNQADALQKQIALLQQQNDDIQASAEAFERFNPGPANAAKVTENWTKATAEQHANNEKILDDLSKFGELASDGANKISLLDEAQAAAAKQAKDTLDNLIASENQYLATLERGYQLQLQSLTAGPTTTQRLQDIAQINAQALQQRQQLDQAKRINPELPNYDAQVKAIAEAHQKALDDTDAYYAAVDQAQSNWLTGAQKAFNTYEEDAHNVADLMDTAFTGAFQSIEDSIVNFATTGKFSFKDLADSILGDLVRMETKILESKALESIFGAFGFGGSDFGAAGFGAAADSSITDSFTLGSIPGAATGGQISGPTIVGEAGPELFIPNQSGFVVPNHALRNMGAGGVNITQNLYPAPGNNVAQMQAMLEQAKAATKAEIANEIYRGGWKPILQKGLS